ncbi:DNA/RNA non-specific endonuclease [Solobacterium sp.]|uniref:DNA/RNA non-specific endonuclease n=1 Tax=Solobacterium sp. TaxID=2060878 RepID=UPI0025EB6EF5|nr:DNA/RNA non-specific endonuclease [Solobacterium sp.]
MTKMMYHKSFRRYRKRVFSSLLLLVLSAVMIWEAFFSTIPVNRDAFFSLSDIPAYTSSPYVEVNHNIPFFTEEELKSDEYESYSELDYLGRCGPAMAMIGIDMMPTQKRGSISMVKPTGWHLAKYDFIDGKYLYNRCHLIAYELSGENANVQNLITGTRYMNVVGMQPFEDKTAWYILRTGNHVLYRCTPIFEGDNLLATGVLLEARSIEDHGEGICFNVFCYNVQPNIKIDYHTGDHQLVVQD